MRKLLLSGMMLALSACSQTNLSEIQIEPTPKLNSVTTENKAFSLESQDLREERYIARLKNGQSNTKFIQSMPNPAKTIESALAYQFMSQGYRITPQNVNIVTIDLVKALSNIENNILSHEMNTEVKIQVTAESSEKKFVKTYTGSAINKGLVKASNEKIRIVFNDILNAVLQDVAEEPSLNLFINENF